MTSSRYLLLLSLVISSVLAQDPTSTSDSLLTIQTSPPTPISSSSAVSPSSSNSNSHSSSGISLTVTSTAPSSSSSPASFPGNCQGECEDISRALASCGAGDALNTTCLCTPLVEADYVSCLQCGLSLDPSESERQVYQGILDSYINQCASAPFQPISLPNVTITLPSSASSSSSASTSGSASTSSAVSLTSTSSSTSDTLTYPSSSMSRGPITSSITASASNRPSASTSASADSGSARKVDNGFMSIGLAGVVGVVIAAAAI